MTKYIATEMMDAHNVNVGASVDMSAFNFLAGDTVTINDRNGIKWYEVEMKSSTTGVIKKQYVKIDNDWHKEIMQRAMNLRGG